MKVLEKSREERQGLPQTQKARRRRLLLGANLVPKRRRWLAASKKKNVAAAPKAAPKPKSAPTASLGSIGIEQWVQSTRSVRTSSLAAMQGRAAAAAGNVRSVHTDAPKSTTRKTNNSESTPRLGRPRAEGKIFALLYILVAFIFMSFSVFFSRIELGTLHGIFGSVTADAEARLFLNAREILF
jgi:hypothetical protein